MVTRPQIQQVLLISGIDNRVKDTELLESDTAVVEKLQKCFTKIEVYHDH